MPNSHVSPTFVQNTFNVAIAAVPSWEQARDALDAFDVEGEAGLLRSVAALDPLLKRLDDALRENDLWDVRKV